MPVIKLPDPERPQRPIDRVTDALERAECQRGYGNDWTCPAHDDEDPSLSVNETDDGRVLLHCHAGCEYRDVLDALELKPAALFPESAAHDADMRVTGRYDYRGERGELLYQVVRP